MNQPNAWHHAVVPPRSQWRHLVVLHSEATSLMQRHRLVVQRLRHLDCSGST